ncbi:MarR family winged helix-turn-helix transcriptional regulator [Streptomyces sp. NPDC051218]|uniref:MarR family winged helix-turn-helix transcriptional regulator n=1 Tax=Streptomyces sp. NPDC051218 TaxID=3365645 RepID=UPI0037A2E73D
MDPDFAPQRRLLTAVKRAEHATQAAKSAAVREAGMTMAQYNVMILLTETPGITSAELARRCFVSSQSMNETVTKLEREGWIERSRHATHRHVREAHVTPEGQSVLERADRQVIALERRLRERLSAEQQDQLRDLLETVERIARDHDVTP